MRLLDLFCGAGGAAMGYHRAGFDEIIGVDNRPQPHYPFKFVLGDALAPPFDLHDFDAIHASPPCQAYSVMKSLKHTREHPDLVASTRAMLQASDTLWVMENVPGAPLRATVMLCGSMFGLRSTGERYLRRHRYFEFGGDYAMLFAPAPCNHRGLAVGVYGHGSAGRLGQRMRTAKAAEARVLMGMDWATRDGMSQAVPPAYTQFIGEQLLAALTELQKGEKE